MANDKRRFELPGIEDLTEEQEAVLDLPLEGRHLVVGGPGTGKTVVCLLRARDLALRKNEYQFLVWTRLLHRASLAMFDGELRAWTWDSWFRDRFRELVGKAIPTRSPKPSGYRPIDWGAVKQAVDNRSMPKNGLPKHPLLVIDEGQDMPPAFYRNLAWLGFENFFVAADQNQQIKKDENSSRKELMAALALKKNDVTKLRYNHRNSYPVARLAQAFYTGDPAVSAPDLPPRGSALYTPRLYVIDEDAVPRIAKSILTHWDQDPRRLIGVIAPSNNVREKYHREIVRRAQSISLDNGCPNIETFYGNNERRVQFDRGGILVINAQACKGLEFETVVLADIHKHNAYDLDQTKKLFYVMVSRARHRVVMFMQSNVHRIEKILPNDESVLHRQDLR